MAKKIDLTHQNISFFYKIFSVKRIAFRLFPRTVGIPKKDKQKARLLEKDGRIFGARNWTRTSDLHRVKMAF